METKPVSERQIKLRHHGCLQAANRAADVADWNREELVDHQLGSFAQAIHGAGLNNDPHQRGASIRVLEYAPGLATVMT